MKIEHGTGRTVIILWGFVVKIPKVEILKSYICDGILQYIHYNKEERIECKEYFEDACTWLYGKSVHANRREYELSRKKVSGHLAKVYLMLTGYVLIQKCIVGKVLSHKQVRTCLHLIFDDAPHLLQKYYRLGMGAEHGTYEDWVDTGDGIVLRDYGGDSSSRHFSDCLEEHAERFEKRLKVIRLSDLEE